MEKAPRPDDTSGTSTSWSPTGLIDVLLGASVGEPYGPPHTGHVDAADIALVIPVDGDRVHLVEQYRHPVGGRRWEFPSGSVDRDRDADAAAAAGRELREETGLTAARLVTLGTLEVLPSTWAQRCHVFLATDLTTGPDDRDPEEADLRSTWCTRAVLERWIVEGDLTDAKSLAAYSLLLLSEAEPLSARRGRRSRA